MRPGTQLVFTGFVVVASYLISQLIAAMLAIPFFGTERVMTILSGFDFSDPAQLAFLKYLQVFQSIGLFILPSLLLAKMFNARPGVYLMMHRSVTFPTAILAVLLIFVVNPLINYSGAINAAMHFPEWLSGLEQWMRNAEDAAEKLTEAFLMTNNISGLAFNLFMIALLPALGEELLFRGIIQKLFAKMTHSHHWGIWLSAILFSALHMQFYGFIPRLLLGAIFGYLLVWSGSLWLPVLGHFVNNAAAVVLLYLIEHQKLGDHLGEIGSNQWHLALFSLIASGLILWVIHRMNQPVWSDVMANDSGSDYPTAVD